MAIVIGAPASGSGKTTVTLGILAALKGRGLHPQSFKVGPDYIDPLFHQAITNLPCRNLDPFLTSEPYVKRCFAHHSWGRSGAVIEGVMGLFDGKVNLGSNQPDWASTAHVARILNLPIVLVIDAAKMGRSIAALVYGLTHYDPRLQIAGVILNRVGSPRHGEILREALRSLSTPVLGAIPRDDTIHLPSRHLGLIPVGELSTFQSIQIQLATLAEHCLDWDQLLPLIQSDCDRTVSHNVPDQLTRTQPGSPLKLGIAWDQAFNFYYADNLDLLRQQGVELSFFSPLKDGFGPVQSCHGLYLGGGFPEIFAAELSEQILRSPYPISLPPLYAECGGLMVLGRSLTDLKGNTYPMLNQLPIQVQINPKLTLGYRWATALRSTPALTAGQQIRGHEFHRSSVLPQSPHPIYQWDQTTEGWATDRIHASYLHLHWGDHPQLIARFLQTVQDRSRSQV